MNKEQIKTEILIAEAQGYKQSQPIDTSNFILDSDKLTVGNTYKGIPNGDYSIQKWVNANGEKMIGVKTNIILTDDEGKPLHKRIFGDYESNTEISASLVLAEKDGKPLLSKTGTQYKNLRVLSTQNTIGAKVAENIGG